MYIVILAGGSGTRFWPLSRKRMPKQLISVFGGRSMLQRTVERVIPLSPKRILVVTNELQAAETARQLESLTKIPIDIIAEPKAKNTAPAIGLAASIIARYDPDGVMVVLPADHYIVQEERFREVLREGVKAALDGSLVTLGITPTRPETGYGYIEAEERPATQGSRPVRRFVEKPPLERAMEFMAAGNFFWNSGMFVWQACTILDRIREHMPQLSQALARLEFSPDIWEIADLKPRIDSMYEDVPAESIDYGVMERARDVVVIPAEFGWSDVGSWNALPELMEGDNAGNVYMNTPAAVTIDADGCLFYGGGRLAALVGVRDLIIVNTGDALLVCDKGRAQDVKKVVEELERRGLADYI